MSRSVAQPAPWLQDQVIVLWSDPEELNQAVRQAMDAMLGHDVERVASLCGVSRRELNKQREYRQGDEFGMQLLHRLCELGGHVARLFGPGRTEAAARLFATICGHDLARAVSAAAMNGEAQATCTVIARCMAESGDAVARASKAAEDGLDGAECRSLIPEVDQAISELHTLRNLLVMRSLPRRGVQPPRGGAS